MQAKAQPRAPSLRWAPALKDEDREGPWQVPGQGTCQVPGQGIMCVWAPNQNASDTDREESQQLGFQLQNLANFPKTPEEPRMLGSDNRSH